MYSEYSVMKNRSLRFLHRYPLFSIKIDNQKNFHQQNTTSSVYRKIFSHNFQFSRLPFIQWKNSRARLIEFFHFDRYWSSAVSIPFCFIPQILRSSIINHWKWKLLFKPLKVYKSYNKWGASELFIFLFLYTRENFGDPLLKSVQ